jgi:hypothetical protein
MKNFDSSAVLADLVVDQDWAVQQLPDLRAFSNEAAQARIEQGGAKMRRSLIVFGDVTNDLSKISPCFLREEDPAIHLAKSLRASSDFSTHFHSLINSSQPQPTPSNLSTSGAPI